MSSFAWWVTRKSLGVSWWLVKSSVQGAFAAGDVRVILTAEAVLDYFRITPVLTAFKRVSNYFSYQAGAHEKELNVFVNRAEERAAVDAEDVLAVEYVKNLSRTEIKLVQFQVALRRASGVPLELMPNPQLNSGLWRLFNTGVPTLDTSAVSAINTREDFLIYENLRSESFARMFFEETYGKILDRLVLNLDRESSGLDFYIGHNLGRTVAIDLASHQNLFFRIPDTQFVMRIKPARLFSVARNGATRAVEVLGKWGVSGK